MKEIFLILAALTGAPQPAPEFRAPISEETAAAMLDTIINGDPEAAPNPAQDYNGDGALNIADFYGISRRTYINNHEQTEITADAETVEAIAAELFPAEELIYFEFDFIGGSPCRAYEATADEITTASIYFEFEDWSTSAAAEINPHTETITIIKEV